ncbi:hypothetical protein Ava_B0154 (plasmid) [Trichormus variabilis ATCC 29413]|uniref:Uncharacterized protein n=2 Tax=Anabaena variabilis TaxID=264691 RepID=Q3M2C0_TRIV2|nr:MULTISPECIES: hypothetical protein [Nostocaceae]ABA24866.1 hypothetical protein Ava_B0154 [Trichormus variabilis ATCC 29413]MBC1217999.1 hypothetical protein [Trichormus variabilis ARAD]MBC1259279.1 hypothetical protein [Trichormus variabilis V5]MBC1270765.1 hypothetical protein [Trichormus variabilis FSR]MBC1305704.1 hypothetical protein [Trichormus variabilis N2B]
MTFSKNERCSSAIAVREPSISVGSTSGVVVIKNKKTGKSLRYVIPAAARSLLDNWNQDLGDSVRVSVRSAEALLLSADRQRYDAVMNTSSDSLFRVDKDKKTDEKSPKV